MGLETAIAIGSMAIQAGGSGFSFAQAAKQRKELDKANKAAQKAVSEAKALTDMNQLDKLQVPLEPYKTMSREVTAQQMQSLQALQESDARSLAAGVGKIGAVGTDYLEKVRGVMSQDIYNNDLLKAQEDIRLQNQKMTIAQSEAEGAQLAAADAQKYRNQAITQGVQGLAGAALTGVNMLPEYTKDRQLMRDFNVAKEGGFVANLSENEALAALAKMKSDDPTGYADMISKGEFGGLFGADVNYGKLWAQDRMAPQFNPIDGFSKIKLTNFNSPNQLTR